MKRESFSTFIARNARFIWLILLFFPPAAAFGAYSVTPHEEIWHDVLYSLFCLPLFGVWLLALFSCIFSFLVHRTLTHS